MLLDGEPLCVESGGVGLVTDFAKSKLGGWDSGLPRLLSGLVAKLG